MRRRLWLVCTAICSICACSSFGLDMSWTYHDDGDDIDDRGIETAPGQYSTFVKNGGTVISTEDAVILYVLTAHDFAGEREEQVFARWWNGEEEHWIMGSWETNVRLGDGGDSAGKFHGLPRVGSVMLDLWKIEIGAELTRPGENFYVLQVKGWAENMTEEAFLLRDKSDDGQENELGQAWTSGEYFGHDWSMTITE